MKINLSRQGEAQIDLESGECFYFPLSYQAVGQFGIRLFPPFPFSSPIARLLHGRYRLANITAPVEGARIVLNEPNAQYHFYTLTLDRGQRFFIDCEHLVGFSFSAGGTMGAQPQRLLSASCWLIGHPLPVIATGPGTILLTGCRLHEERGALVVLPKQVVAFDATARWTVRAPRSDREKFSQLWNIVSGQCCMTFVDDTVVVRSLVMPSTASRLLKKIFMVLGHLAIIVIVYKLLLS